MNQTKQKQLNNIWSNVRHIGGWLRLLEMTGEYSPEEIDYFEQIDQEFLEIAEDCKKYYYDIEKPKVDKALQDFKIEVMGEFGTELKKIKSEILANDLKRSKELLGQIYKNYSEGFEKDVPFWFRKVVLELNNSEGLIKKINSLEKQIYLSEQPAEKKKNYVSEEEIQRALEKPIEQLFEENGIKVKKHFCLCPFHSDKKPSMYLKNNFYYCFSCGASGNTINFLIKHKEYSFQEAVRELN